MTQSPLEIRLLGSTEIRRGGDVVPIRGAKQRRLLAILALKLGEVVPAERLVDALWEDNPPAKPLNALQAQVSSVRRLLPDGVLVTKGTGYALELESGAVDIDRFERAVAAALRLRGEGRPEEAVTTLRDALALWRGPALADVAYDEFAQAGIARLEEARLAAIEARIDAEIAAGHGPELIGELEALCATFPLREALWAHRMVALYRAGRQADALRAYAEARERLVAELGIEPGPALRQLEARVLAQDPSLDASAAAPARPRASARDGGNIPARLTSFVGRDTEIAEVLALLDAGRLVTLVGPGGAGKTRLAVEVADQLGARLRDGAWLVELAPVADGDGVAPAVAAALGVGEASTMREQPADPVARLAAHLTGRDALVVLDNCEHVIAAVAGLAERLLGEVSSCRVLATSREALGIRGEHLLPISPLGAEAAAELFANRAAAVSPGFDLTADNQAVVDDICHRLDGLPLAIELAAARLRALPLSQVASRLDDRFRLLTGGARTALPRQQTLRAVVDWSYDLLFDEERLLFSRLAVFAGGCSAEAAEAVCSDEVLPGVDVLDLLARLVDKSLVTMAAHRDGIARYHQLQTLWQYGRERLAASGDADAIRDRHARWYLDMAAGAEEGLRGSTGPEWRGRLAPEMDNLRAALDWMCAREDAEGALRLVVGMAWWWFLRADWHEASRWFTDALACPGTPPVALRARAAAWRAYYGAVEEGVELHAPACAAALATVQEHGTVQDVGEVALLYASTLNRGLRSAECLEVLPLAAAALREAGHGWGLATHDLLAASALARLGRFDEAEATARRSLEQYEAIGERWAVVEPLGIIATLHEIRGDLPEALEAYDRVVRTTRELDLPGYLAYWLNLRGVLATRLGDDSAAVDAFSEAVEISHNPANTGVALVGRARAAARLARPATPPDTNNQLRAGRAAFEQVGRRDGLVVALIAEALTMIDTGDVGAATPLVDEARNLDSEVAALADAAFAFAAGDDQRAADLLERWDAHHRPHVPGSIASLLAADHAALATCVAAAATR